MKAKKMIAFALAGIMALSCAAFAWADEAEVAGQVYVKVYPTCTSEGMYSDGVVIPALGHNIVVTTAPTCTTEGLKECTRCDECDEVLPVVDHDYTKEVVTKASTCTESGEAQLVCSVCGDVKETYTLEKDPTNHSTDDTEENVIETVAKTCTTDGYTVTEYTCAACGAVVKTEKVTDPATGHTWGEAEPMELPVCQETTRYYKVCSVCGAEEVTAENFVDHDFSEIDDEANWVVEVEPTCATEGKAYVVCHNAVKYNDDGTVKECGEHYEFAIPTLEHVWCDLPDYYVEDGDVEVIINHCELCGIAHKIIKNGDTVLSETFGDDAVIPTEPVVPEETVMDGFNAKTGEFMVNGEVATEVTGLITYNGAQFLVVNGVLKPVNGVALMLDNQFYFFANGQVQSQFSGLAMYDGESFILENGIVNISYNGLYTYDGREFIVAVGRIVTEANGLVLVGGEWVFAANGQVSDYTGTVIYDGAVFDIENGRLVA